MEFILQQNLSDEPFVEFESWYPDMTTNPFYVEDSLFSKPGNTVQSVKSVQKFISGSHMTDMKHITLSSFDAMDARVPEFESSIRSLSCSSSEETLVLKNNHHQKNNLWDDYFSKNPLDGLHAEESVSHISSYVSDIVEENETFRDLTELLLEQEGPLPKNTPPHIIRNDLQMHQLPSSTATLRSEDSRSPLIGSFAVDLSPSTSNGGKKVEVKYKEMRRKNNIASRNARVARRDKERQMEERARQLEQDNQALRIKVLKMEELTQELKTRLIQSVTRNK